MRRFVIVAGLAGAGKSQAMKAFEDLGFYCSDNVPPVLARDLVELCERAGIDRLALALESRTNGPFGNPVEVLDAFRKEGRAFELLFLDAVDDVLIRRYSETRQRHPFEDAGQLSDAIAADRAASAPFRALADRIVDTSNYTHGRLKAEIAAAYAEGGRSTLAVHVISFGFKHGVPADADLVFDVRFLPNPNYVPELRPQTGADPDVAAYLEGSQVTREFVRRLFAMLDFLIPHYVIEGKARLTIAIGCTGGRHRSVYIGERVAEHLRDAESVIVSVEARDCGRR